MRAKEAAFITQRDRLGLSPANQGEQGNPAFRFTRLFSEASHRLPSSVGAVPYYGPLVRQWLALRRSSRAKDRMNRPFTGYKGSPEAKQGKTPPIHLTPLRYFSSIVSLARPSDSLSLAVYGLPYGFDCHMKWLMTLGLRECEVIGALQEKGSRFVSPVVMPSASGAWHQSSQDGGKLCRMTCARRAVPGLRTLAHKLVKQDIHERHGKTHQ